ncbi:MAG: hypothetical protein ACXWQZ_13270 [Ktedonobacterales bacterium]
MPSQHYPDHLTGNQIHTTCKNFGNSGNTSGNNLIHNISHDTTLALNHDMSGNTGNDSGNKIGKTGNIAQWPPHHTIPGHTSLSAICAHHKKRNRGKNGNASRMPHRRTISAHTPSANLTGNHSGKKTATIPATSAAHNPSSPTIATTLPHPNPVNACQALVFAAARGCSQARLQSPAPTITARLARVKNEKMRNFRHIVVRCPYPAPA